MSKDPGPPASSAAREQSIPASYALRASKFVTLTPYSQLNAGQNEAT